MSLKIGGSKGGSKTSGTSTTDNTLDPFIAGILGDAYGRATKFADTPWDPAMVAGVQPLMQQSWDAVGGLGQPGGLLRDSAVSGLQGFSSYQHSPISGQTPRMTASQSPLFSAGDASMIDPSSIATAGLADRSAVRDVNLSPFTGQSIRELMNPFESDVVSAFQADAERARQGALSNDSAMAAKAGAWGGSRHGVREGQTSGEYMRALDSATAGLRHQGWSTAGQLALGARGQDLSAAQSNQQADLGVLGMNAETGRFNAGQANQGLFYNADAANRRGEFNAGQANAWANNEANRAQEASQTNANNALAALLNDSNNALAAGTAADANTLKGLGLMGDWANDADASAKGFWGLLNTAAGQQQGYAQSVADSQFGWPLTQLDYILKAAGLFPAITDSTGTTTGKGSFWKLDGSVTHPG